MIEDLEFPAYSIRDGHRLPDLKITLDVLRTWTWLVQQNRAPVSQDDCRREMPSIKQPQQNMSKLHQAGIIERWDRGPDRSGARVDLWVLTPFGRKQYPHTLRAWSRITEK